MKQITLTFLLLFTGIGFSQDNIISSDISTNYEEYNFLTERFGIEDNLQMMDGYELENFMQSTSSRFKFSYQLFIETNTKNVKAVFITITKLKKKDDKVRYLCIPINNGELFKKFLSEAEGLGVSMSIGLEAMNKVLLSKLIDEKYNTKQ